MADYPYLPLWTDAYLADTGHLSDQEHGAYLRLLMLMWRTPGCRVPNDDEWLAKRWHEDEKYIKAVLRPLIKEFCKSDGNWITQKRLFAEKKRCQKKSRAQSVRAKSLNKGNKDTLPGCAGSAVPPEPEPDKEKKPKNTRARPTLEASLARSREQFFKNNPLLNQQSKTNGSARKNYAESLGAIMGGQRDTPIDGPDYDDPSVRKARWRQKLHNYLVGTLGLESNFVGDLWDRYDAGEVDGRRGIEAFSRDMKAEEEAIRARANGAVK